MKRVKKNLSHILPWVSIPFLLVFVDWVIQYTVEFPNSNIEIKSYYSVLKEEYILGLLISVLGIFGYYTTSYYLAPRILEKVESKKLIVPIAVMLVVPLLVVLCLMLLVPMLAWFWGHYIYIAYIIVICFSIVGALKRVRIYSIEKENENAILQQQNLEAQLALLKSQINPHFLFNSINNIDVLIESNPTKASKYLKKTERNVTL